MITIHSVSSKHDWKQFFEFPNQLYKDNPYYVPTLVFDEKLNFNPKKNPAFEYIDSVAFLAKKRWEGCRAHGCPNKP